jgi:hypothetical protein
MNGVANWPFSTHVSLLGLLKNMFWGYYTTVFFIYCMHFLKSVSLNSVVQLIHIEADIFAVCICNKFGDGEWFVPEKVGDGRQPVGYGVGQSADCKCCQ